VKRFILAGALSILAASLVLAVASAQTPTIIVRHSSMFTGVQPPGRHADLGITVSEFAPGARNALHYQTATRYFTVIEGELTITIGTETKVYSSGMSGVSPGGRLTRFSNEHGTVRAQLFIASLWPPQPGGGPLASALVLVEPLPELLPRVIARGWLPQIEVPTTGVNIQQVVQVWEPGARNAPHTMNHPHLFIALEGENTTRYLDGGVERTVAGQQGVMEPGRPGIMENSGTTNNVLLVAWVLTPGISNTSPVSPAPAPAVSPPSVGDAGLAARNDGLAGPQLLASVAAATGILMIACVNAARRRAGR
jgi:quercetin dioxygenase-like cupin family protein